MGSFGWNGKGFGAIPSARLRELEGEPHGGTLNFVKIGEIKTLEIHQKRTKKEERVFVFICLNAASADAEDKFIQGFGFTLCLASVFFWGKTSFSLCSCKKE